MNINEFIQKNNEFLGYTHNNELKGKLLVEAPNNYVFITHCMAMQTLILNQANGLQPLWIKGGNDIPIELLQSYVPSAKYIELPRLTIIDSFLINFMVFFQFLKVLLAQKIISYKFDSVKYGDIVYDSYLAEDQVGTIKKINLKVLKLMRKVAKKHVQIKKIIKKENIDAVLASHRIGVNAGTMVRSALIKKCKAYTNSGMHRNTLYMSKNKKEMLEYEYTPTKIEINEIMQLDDEVFNKKFEEIKNFHLCGNLSADAKYAFSDENVFFEGKKSFCEKYNLDTIKKNVFVMLHAFTDHPHSHFKGMIFKDYGDWFLKTLEFAKQDKNVNWIFKQHPSDKFYPTKDIIFEDLFKNTPENILFLSTEDKLDTRSLGNIADAIITCVGSAGFEIPAFYGIPSITAGDNHYMGYEFSQNPRGKKEYYELLKNLKNIKKISPFAQRQAKAVYMFIYRFSTVDYSFNPVLSLEDHHNPELSKIFFDKVLELYEQKKDVIQNEIARYSFEVSRNDFKALRTKDYKKYEDYLVFPYDVTQPMNKHAIEIMKEGCEILKEMNIPYCLADGTLLGVYRDNKLIAHDTDIDVNIVYPVDTAAIIREFTKNGFKIGRLPISYGEVQQIGFYKKEILFDIVFYKKNGDSVYNFCEKDFYFKHEAKNYEKFIPYVFDGYEFFIHNEVELWLEHTYGNWRVPNGEKPKDWRDGGDHYLTAVPYDGDSRKILG